MVQTTLQSTNIDYIQIATTGDAKDFGDLIQGFWSLFQWSRRFIIMSRLNVGNLFNENEDGAPVVSGISTFSSPNYFVPPSGSTAQRPQNPGEGMIRFNTDSGHLEYYTGTHWADVITNNNELGDQNQTNSAGGTGTRAVYGGGGPAPATFEP